MGLDWLDIRFRLEGRFDVTIRDADFAHLWGRGRADLTAGELFEVVCGRPAARSVARTARQYFTPGGE